MMQYLFIVSAGAFSLRDAQVPTVAAPLAAAAAVAPAVVTPAPAAVPVVGAAPAALSPEAAAQEVMEQQLLNDPAVASASAEAETWAEKFGTITANLTVHAITEVVGKVARGRAWRLRRYSRACSRRPRLRSRQQRRARSLPP